MARFHAEPSTVGELLSAAGTGFYVPTYQRKYRWDEKNAGRLIEDILDGLSRFVDTGKASTFLGTVIVVNDPANLDPPPQDRPNAVHQIIDGQQRITTLLVLLGELYRAIEREVAGAPTAVLEAFGREPEKVAYQLGSCLRFRLMEPGKSLLPRLIRGGHDSWSIDHPLYQSDIAQYLSSFDPSNRPHYGNDLLDRVVREFHRRIGDSDFLMGYDLAITPEKWRDLFGSEPPGPVDHPKWQLLYERLVFAQFLMNMVQLILVRAEDEDAAFAIFEPLNTTGQPLTAFETLIPLVVREVGGQVEYATAPQRERILAFQSMVDGAKNVNDAMKRSKLAIIPFALSQDGTRLGQQLQDQRRYLRQYSTLKRNEQAVFLDGLASTGDFLQKIWFEPHPLGTSSEVTRVSLKMLDASNHTIPQALLIRGFEEYAPDEPRRFDQLIEVVASFWVLWRLSRSGTEGIETHHRGLLAGSRIEDRQIGPYARLPNKGEGLSPHPDDVRTDLRLVLEAKGDIDSRETWISRASHLAHGGSTNRRLLMFALLGAYDNAIAEVPPSFLKRGMAGHSPTLTVEWFEGDLTIEHVGPQKPRHNDDTFDPAIYSQSVVHRLGNLTLAPRGENAALGNLPWPMKRHYYRVFSDPDPDSRVAAVESAEMSVAASTKKLLMKTLIPFTADLAAVDAEVWSEALVEARSRRIAELIWDRFSPSLGYPAE